MRNMQVNNPIFKLYGNFNGPMHEVDIYNITSVINDGLIVEVISAVTDTPLNITITVYPNTDTSVLLNHILEIECNGEERTVMISGMQLSFKFIMDVLSTMQYFKGKINNPAYIEKMAIIQSIINRK